MHTRVLVPVKAKEHQIPCSWKYSECWTIWHLTRIKLRFSASAFLTDPSLWVKQYIIIFLNGMVYKLKLYVKKNLSDNQGFHFG